MKLIVWLGNPGTEYSNTRHNIGFIFIDYLREHWRFEDFKDSKFKWLISEWNIFWEKIILLKPMTYMNLSWETVLSLVNYYKIWKKDILILSDDIDMEFGKIRFRDKGSSWWQNGIKSISKNLWTEEFSRCKLGIWRDSRYLVVDWVLSKFSDTESILMQEKIFPEAFLWVEKYLLGR